MLWEAVTAMVAVVAAFGGWYYAMLKGRRTLMRTFALALTIVFGLAPAATAAVEEVYVEAVLGSGNKAIVVRKNGDAYLIEHGVGCLSIWRFKEKQVVITSPGLFLGVGSELLLPGEGQTCRIWSGELIDRSSSSPGGSGGRYQFVSPGAEGARALREYLRDNPIPPSAPAAPIVPYEARIYVEGGTEEQRRAALELLRCCSPGMIDVPYRKRPEANISLRKDGTAEVKCGDFKEVLPGPTLPDIVKQFRAWLPDKLAARRREKGGPPIPQDLSLPMPGFP